jgi:drug/metabolite transporter (DMT)-like permease
MTPAAHRRGLALMIGATLCWASAGVLMRNMNITNGWEVTFWRSVFMSVFLLAVLRFQHGPDAMARIRAVGWPGVVSALLLTVMFVGFILAMTRTTVANVLVVASSSPFFAALFGRIFLHERVAGRSWAAMAVAVCGIGVMFLGSLSGEGWGGILVALVVPVAYGLNIAILRHMHAQVDMIPAILLGGLVSSILTLPMALPFTATGSDFVLLAIMGAIQLGLGCVLMTLASRHLPSAEIGLLSVLETLFGVGSVWAFVGEQPGAGALLGGTMVIGAIAANQWYALRAHPTRVGA